MARKKNGGNPLPEWLRGKSEEALRRMYEIAECEETKPELRVQIYKFLVELELSAAASPTQGRTMSLAERREAILDAARLLRRIEQETSDIGTPAPPGAGVPMSAESERT